MNVKQALNIIRPEEASEAGLKKAYRSASMEHHPDCGGSVEMMQLVNAAMEALTNCSTWWTPLQAKQAKRDVPLTEQVKLILRKINNFPGLNYELVGDWLWITGDTKKYKEYLKKAGLKFSKNKTAWYWHPPGYRKNNKKKFSMNDIRTRWGSQDITQSRTIEIAA